MSLSAQILRLEPEALASLKEVILGASERDGRAAAKNVGPGRYYDPKTGKTFKLKQPVRRSSVYQQAEQLQKAAVANLRNFCAEHKLAYDKSTNSTKMAEGGGKPPSEIQKKLDVLVGDLKHAKAQFKLVREEQNARRTTVAKTTVDATKRPTVQKDATGKLIWADVPIEDNVPTGRQ